MKSKEDFCTKRKNGYGTVLLGLLVILLFPGPAFSHCVDRPHAGSFEPRLAVGWELTPTGLAVVYYSEDGGPSDHLSLHRILHHGFDALPLEDLKRSFGPTASVLRSDESGQGHPYYYVILTNPLFYGSMLDGFGFATHTWLDREEDGLNGNELRTTLFH